MNTTKSHFAIRLIVLCTRLEAVWAHNQWLSWRDFLVDPKKRSPFPVDSMRVQIPVLIDCLHKGAEQGEEEEWYADDNNYGTIQYK